MKISIGITILVVVLFVGCGADETIVYRDRVEYRCHDEIVMDVSDFAYLIRKADRGPYKFPERSFYETYLGKEITLKNVRVVMDSYNSVVMRLEGGGQIGFYFAEPEVVLEIESNQVQVDAIKGLLSRAASNELGDRVIVYAHFDYCEIVEPSR